MTWWAPFTYAYPAVWKCCAEVSNQTSVHFMHVSAKHASSNLSMNAL